MDNVTALSADTIESLTALYQGYCETQNLPQISADELLSELYHRRDCLPGQIVYVRTFLERWDKAVRAETEAERFKNWRESRKWFHDLRDFAPDADDECCGPGYGYNCGWIKLNTTDQQELGRYMTLCPFDVWGDLDRCETALWENHASAEEMGVNR
jgi:hypothetical protein